LNKWIGSDLGISEITVKAHRGKVMRKMGAASLAELVAMSLRLELPAAPDATRTTATPVEARYDTIGLTRFRAPYAHGLAAAR
jgi:hypothetical protein